ncbi:MAG: Asp-tRNA(Asn)/Glu-tRNA(Gln) amidotransferase subunit GatC [Candidatus Magasanikbacteria bacterium]
MSLTIEEVRKIAQLARVELTPTEEKRHAETISTVLDFVNTLNEVDTEGVEPTAQVTGLEDVTREDVVKNSAIKKELIKQMPQVSAGLLKVPAVFGDSEDVI